jgi:hypothetical protein
LLPFIFWDMHYGKSEDIHLSCIFIFMNKILCLAVFLSACYSKEKKDISIAHHAAVVSAKKTNYDSCKKAIAIIKRQHKTSWATLSKIEKEKCFANAITTTIAPAWLGTKWDFNGITEVPQQGKIACGYFVTTVLRDAGLPIERIKLAQCASEKLVTSLVQDKYVKRFSHVGMDDFMAYLKLNGFGLYIVGLDNHTGFIFNDGVDIWFIHSSIVGTRDVQKEKSASSSILQKSKYRIVGKISADELVLRKWILT